MGSLVEYIEKKGGVDMYKNLKAQKLTDLDIYSVNALKIS